MILRRMQANFGCLKNAELRLKPGLNIIEAPNESGKSTWCAFLRCMLYGVDSARRGPFTDKQRYAPWDGSAMEGQIQLEYEGRDITLYRRSHHGPMRDFAALYTGSGESVSGLGAADAGQQLTGFVESVFERSAFVRQGAIAVDNSPELEKRLSSLLTAGEEGASFAEAEQRLLAWQRSRRSRGRGHLPVLEAEITGIREELSYMDALEAELTGLERKAESAGEAWKAQLQKNEHGLESRRRRLDEARAAVTALEESAREAERRCGAEPESAAAVGRGLWFLWSLIVFASVALLFFGKIWGVIPLAVGILGAVWDILRQRQYRAAVQHLEAKRERWRQQHARAARCRREAEAARGDLRELENELFRPDEEAERLLCAAEQAFHAAREECAAKIGELRNRGDRMVLETRLRALESEHSREEERYTALDIALEELRGAYEELQSRFSPMLARKTADLFELLTDGRYGEVLLQRNLTALVQRRGESVPHESAFLSRGAAGQLYLTLRLGLLELLDEEGLCPLILDDAFVSFDDERLRRTLVLLKELGEKRQIILFTCQKREMRMMQEMGG